MMSQIWFTTGPGNGLLHDGTKSLPGPMLTYHEWDNKELTGMQFEKKKKKKKKNFTVENDVEKLAGVSAQASVS